MRHTHESMSRLKFRLSRLIYFCLVARSNWQPLSTRSAS